MNGDPWFLLLLTLLPAVVVFLTAFYLIRGMLQSRAQEKQNEWLAQIKKEDHKHALPLRLQAYERLTLFLERITPGALVLRVHKANMSSRMLHADLLATVREEFEHNVTQQIYVSDKAWGQVKMAKEETLRIINIAMEQTGDQPNSSALSQRIFEVASRLTHLPSQQAVLVLKEEVRKLF